jgi:hypothetical protein
VGGIDANDLVNLLVVGDADAIALAEQRFGSAGDGCGHKSG